jgi:hypothetical protein
MYTSCFFEATFGYMYILSFVKLYSVMKKSAESITHIHRFTNLNYTKHWAFITKQIFSHFTYQPDGNTPIRDRFRTKTETYESNVRQSLHSALACMVKISLLFFLKNVNNKLLIIWQGNPLQIVIVLKKNSVAWVCERAMPTAACRQS